MRIYLIIFLSIFIFSCGGGGGSSSPSPIQGSESAPTLVPPTPQPSPVAPTCDDACFQTSKEEYEALYEYSSQIGLGMVNASSSYARKATGEGIIVGVVDSGLDETHPELA